MSRRKIGRKVADIWKDNGRMFGHEHATMVSTRNEDSRSGLNRAALFLKEENTMLLLQKWQCHRCEKG